VAAESELEKELTRRAKQADPQAKTLKLSFDKLKEHLVKHHYPWVQANCRWFTDHGEIHVAAVMHSASELGNCLSISNCIIRDVPCVQAASVRAQCGFPTFPPP
jgi:hypothetical protein